MRIPIAIFGAFLAHAACAQGCDSLRSADWLLGSWIGDEGERHFEESWIKLSNSTFEGSGVTTRKSDSARVDGESLRLVQMGDGVFYVAKVAHNEFPVGFRLVRCAGRTLIFENRTHDFPKRLEYRAVDAETLQVHVSDGADKGFTLTYRRAK